MVNHGVRDHATWSASSTARNWKCPGALALATKALPDFETIHSARGTACHQISEKALRTGKDAVDFLGDIEHTKENSIEIDDELVESAQHYINHVRSLGGQLQIEQRFSLKDLNPPFDAGGTGDAVVYVPDDRRLHVVDLKNGRGLVDADDNPQLLTYALGAMLSNPTLDVETIRVTIVQPRAPHKDGIIRSDTFHVSDLIGWTGELLEAMNRSKKAYDAFKIAEHNEVLFDDWSDQYLVTGKCDWCRAEGFCPKRKKESLKIAEVWFDDFDKPQIGNKPELMSPEKIAHTLPLLDALEDWIASVRTLAKQTADSGIALPGYHLETKYTNRKWSGDEEMVVNVLTIMAGLDPEKIYTKKLVSPAQAEKLLGKKRKELITDLVVREENGTKLVASKNGESSAPQTKAEHYFIETENM